MSGDEKIFLNKEENNKVKEEKSKKLIFEIEKYNNYTNNSKSNSIPKFFVYSNTKEEINNNNNNKDELPPSINEILLNDEEFASPIIKKKENKIISDYHYVTFQNAFGENTCFINVILHLLNNIPELDDYLISLYKIDASNKDIKYKKTNKDDKNLKNINKFLVLLGKILNQYENIIDKENNKCKNKNKKKQVTVVKTLNMRKILESISSNKFPLNSIADPIELFTFILDILNDYLNGDLHKSFYLELIDEFYCKGENNCQNVSNKYDKDNFIYHIYIDEILNFIEKNNLKIKDYKNNLFEYSYKLFLSENTKTCEKCQKKMCHDLSCLNYPEFLLINCVWKESNPIVDDVIKFFLLLSLKDDLNNLFICSKKKKNKKYPYYLLGFILYSFTLSHYIICIYNYNKNLFVLFDDESVKEYNNFNELIIDITANSLKLNGKSFFYPVMLIYTKDFLYDNKIIKFNNLNDNDEQNIIYKCNEAISEYEYQNKINEGEKYNNYNEYIKKQIEIENEIKKDIEKKKRNNNDDDEIININENKELDDDNLNEEKEKIIDINEDEKNEKEGKDKNKIKNNKKKKKKKKWLEQKKIKRKNKNDLSDDLDFLQKIYKDLIENDNELTKSKRQYLNKKSLINRNTLEPILGKKKENEKKRK